MHEYRIIYIYNEIFFQTFISSNQLHIQFALNYPAHYCNLCSNFSICFYLDEILFQIFVIQMATLRLSTEHFIIGPITETNEIFCIKNEKFFF